MEWGKKVWQIADRLDFAIGAFMIKINDCLIKSQTLLSSCMQVIENYIV